MERLFAVLLCCVHSTTPLGSSGSASINCIDEKTFLNTLALAQSPCTRIATIFQSVLTSIETSPPSQTYLINSELRRDHPCLARSGATRSITDGPIRRNRQRRTRLPFTRFSPSCPCWITTHQTNLSISAMIQCVNFFVSNPMRLIRVRSKANLVVAHNFDSCPVPDGLCCRLNARLCVAMRSKTSGRGR